MEATARTLVSGEDYWNPLAEALQAEKDAREGKPKPVAVPDPATAATIKEEANQQLRKPKPVDTPLSTVSTSQSTSLSTVSTSSIRVDTKPEPVDTSVDSPVDTADERRRAYKREWMQRKRAADKGLTLSSSL